MDLTRLVEETEFERLALDTGTPLVEPMYGWVDLRTDPRGNVGCIIGPAAEGAETGGRFAATFRPLLFGAAWKVLDRVVECALPPLRNNNHYTNSSKAARARDLNVPVWAPFVRKDQEWQGALRLFGRTEQLRDGMTHRRVEVATTGGLRVADKGPNSKTVHTLTAEEQLAFCRAAQRFIDAIIAGTIRPRERDDLLAQLGQLERYSGIASTPEDVGMNRLCEVHVNLRAVSPGRVELDVPALQQPMQHQVQYRRFDVVAYLPAPQEGRPLIGKLETAPVEVVQFDPDQPPAWLSRTSQRQTLLG
jgi:hypothetical protein